MQQLIRVAVAFSLASLAGVAAAQSADAKKLKDVLTGDAKVTAANNPQCKLFTPAEIANYLGSPVEAGQNAAGGAGCSWADKNHDALAYVTVVGPTHYVEPAQAKGFKRLTGVGKKAWVAAEAGGWSASALLDD